MCSSSKWYISKLKPAIFKLLFKKRKPALFSSTFVKRTYHTLDTMMDRVGSTPIHFIIGNKVYSNNFKGCKKSYRSI